jgi:hypothetical protein
MEVPNMGTLNTIVKPNGFDASPSSTTLPLAKPLSSPVTTVAPRPSVDPHRLAHTQKLSKTMRAILAAEVLDGNLPLMNLTRDMVARAVGVSTGYVDAARRLTPEQRREVARGKRSLVRKTAPAR